MEQVQLFVYIATSLDGYIARPDGSLDWLPGAGGEEKPGGEDDQAGPPEDYGFGEFLAGVDALLMGRATYDVVRGFDGPWPYGERKVFVLSRSLREADIPPAHRGRVEILAGEPREVVGRLRERGYKRIYLDGGNTIRTFLAAGLVRELTITTIPVLIGRGIGLFGEMDLEKDIRLELVEQNSWPNGMSQRRYRVIKCISYYLI